jgi:hypothetical protein
MHKSKVQEQAFNTIKVLLSQLPYNRTQAYMRIHLTYSRCDLFIPIKQSLLNNAQEYKDRVQTVFDLVEL